MNTSKRLLLLCAATAALGIAGPATAQQDPIRLVIGFAPGGALDSLARGLAEQLGPALGETVLVDNKPGASTMLSIEQVKRAKPNGRTLLIASTPPFVLFPMSYATLNYDVERDFLPVAHLAYTPTVVSAGPGQPYASFKEYVDWLRRTPEQNGFGLTSLGGALHFSILALGKEVGVPLTAVNYKGGAPLVTDIAGGHVPVGTDALGSQLELHRAGRVKILAVAGTQRLKWLPEVPSVHELGYRAFDHAKVSYGAFVPAGTPAAERARLEAALLKAMQAPALLALLDRVGMEPAGQNADFLRASMERERAFWAPVVKASGFKVQP